MRILHTSDWHLGKYLEEYSRLEEQDAFIDELSNKFRDDTVNFYTSHLVMPSLERII